MNNQQQGVQSIDSLVNSLQSVISGQNISGTQTGTSTVQPVADLLPTGADISSQYQQFLNDAANDPNLLAYYNGLITQAQGDTNVAIQNLYNDYQTGVRQTTTNLQNSLAQLGLTFTGEQNSLLDSLNQRGIALTQNGSQLQYAGGGESQTELGNLNQSEALRQQAQQQSAVQAIQNLGNSYQTGVTSANQELQQSVASTQEAEQQDIISRASNDLNASIAQAAQQQNAANLQQQSGGGSGNPYVGQNLTQSQLPSQLFNATGNTTYNGVTYNVQNTGQGTRNISIA